MGKRVRRLRLVGDKAKGGRRRCRGVWTSGGGGGRWRGAGGW